MNRRDTLKSIMASFGGLGMAGLARFLPLSTAHAAHEGEPSDASTVLVEAESFERKGGWVVDQQFVEQMGAPYLLAHGMGKPVENAVTTLRLPAAGSYRLWVRTKDWAPGEWEAPGRFKVSVGEKTPDVEFGTEPGWHWQDGGVFDLPSGKVSLKLIDLTGFDGRCDAVLLTTDMNLDPPNHDPELREFRNALHDSSSPPPLESEFDLIVVGGGISGCAAALAAGKRGLKTALIHDRPVLGGNASGEVRVHTLGLHGHSTDILSRLDTEYWPNGSARALEDDRKRHAEMESAENVQLYLNWRTFDAVSPGDRIESVYARNTRTGEERTFRAPLFIDATGDGWIGYWAGADYTYGRESSETYGEAWARHGDLWSPKEPDDRILGSSLLFGSHDAGSPQSFPEVPWAQEVAKDNAATGGEWYWEYISNTLHQINDAEEIRDHMLRAIYGSFANAKKNGRNQNRRLEFVGYILGKRESRRLFGDYLYTMKDMTSGKTFPDAVVEETREIDLHYSRQQEDPSYPYDFLTEALFHRVGLYYIPYRCLYSRNIANLFLAGRCFSCSHVGLGGPRVMNTCGQMGVATGYAASICNEHGIDPRGVYEDHLEELLLLIQSPEVKIFTAEEGVKRTADRYQITDLPEWLISAKCVTIRRGVSREPGRVFSFELEQPTTIYLSVHERGDYKPPEEWEDTGETLKWEVDGGLHTDRIYKKDAESGTVKVPPHRGRDGANFGLPHLVFVPSEVGVDRETR